MNSSKDLVFTPLLEVLLRREAVGAFDLGGTVGAIVGAAAEGRIDARFRGNVVVRASDTAAFQLEENGSGVTKHSFFVRC